MMEFEASDYDYDDDDAVDDSTISSNRHGKNDEEDNEGLVRSIDEDADNHAILPAQKNREGDVNFTRYGHTSHWMHHHNQTCQADAAIAMKSSPITRKVSKPSPI